MRSFLIARAMIVLLLISVVVFSGPAIAVDIDFSGTFQSHNDVRLYNFTTTTPNTVTLFSSSWDDGGFDPMLGLWNSAGQLIQFQDDGGNVGSTVSNGISYTHGIWDSYYSATITPGTYTISITAFSNFNLGSILSNGFQLDGETPIPIASWNQPPQDRNGFRTANFVFHALNVEELRPVPLPGTLVLFGIGLASLAALRRKKLM